MENVKNQPHFVDAKINYPTKNHLVQQAIAPSVKQMDGSESLCKGCHSRRSSVAFVVIIGRRHSAREPISYPPHCVNHMSAMKLFVAAFSLS